MCIGPPSTDDGGLPAGSFTSVAEIAAVLNVSAAFVDWANEENVNEDSIRNAEVIVLDGNLLERRPLVQRVLQIANKNGIPIAIDAGSVFVAGNKTEDFLQYSRNYPLIIFMNADECIAFYHSIRKGESQFKFTSEKEKEDFILSDICPLLKIISEGDIFPVVVVKLGGRGALAAAGGTIYREETFTINTRNASGAGDAFCAAFLAAWIKDKSIAECLSLGNKAAGAMLSAPGMKKLKSLARLFAK